ncbi:hypothetical protein [Actinopolyspora halophila]|nr:hypothetical protein [Actinopolyspora halophila]
MSAVLMAAAQRADAANLVRLRAEWPELVVETEDRYRTPDGRFPDE